MTLRAVSPTIFGGKMDIVVFALELFFWVRFCWDESGIFYFGPLDFDVLKGGGGDEIFCVDSKILENKNNVTF